MKELKLTSPIPPSVNHYLMDKTIQKNGRLMPKRFKTKEAVDYQGNFVLYVSEQVEKQGWDYKPKDIIVDALNKMDIDIESGFGDSEISKKTVDKFRSQVVEVEQIYKNKLAVLDKKYNKHQRVKQEKEDKKTYDTLRNEILKVKKTSNYFPITQHFYVDTVFYFDKINKDTNNYFKCMLDAITDTGLVWFDDNVTCERVQRIYYDNLNPRIEITIHPVEYVGVFDSREVYDNFIEKCKTCKRYKRNCSILSKAKEGRVTGGILNNVCLKYTELKGDE